MSALVSIVLPVLNEDRLRPYVDAIGETLTKASLAFEIIVVDDGEPDEAHDLGERTRVVRGSRGGKGRAVHDGIGQAAGDVIIVLDADLASLLHLLPRFVALVRNERYDVAIAERQPDWRARHPIRFVLSYGLYLLQRWFVFNSRRFHDTQCGFKAFRGATARNLATLQRVDGGMYDIEYLYIAVKNHWRVAQVPIGSLAESRPSRLRLLKCLRTDPFDLLKIKARGITGAYRLDKDGA